MDTTPNTQERNALFQKLKPCCIKISQLAIRETERPASPRELLELTSQVLGILNEQIEHNPAALDEKLAEYVFFPLYHIFRRMDRYPMLLVENCVKCLHVLITHGWKSKLSAKLVQQILSLLIFIIDGVPGSQTKREVPEETALEAFRAQTALLNTAASSATASSGLAEQDTIPILGHGITVMLDGAADGANPYIQQEALHSLRGVYTTIREHEALASFLPGTISSLAKILSSPNRYKAAVLTGCLENVQLVVTRVLGDMRTRSILAQGQTESQDGGADKGKVLSPAWLKATVSQVKLALSTMMKLRTQDAAQVREALERLCVTLLDECHTTLSNCTTILVETAIILDSGVDAMLSTQTSLSHLVNIYPELGEAAKTTVYNWMSSLSRIMQISDEDSKRIAVHNLSKGLDLLQSLGIESTTLDDSISSTLKDSMVSLVLASSQQVNPSTHLHLLDGNSPARASSNEPLFQPVLLASQSQRGLRTELMGLIDSLGSASQKTKIAARMLEYVRESSSIDQIAAMWLCYELIKAANTSTANADAFLDISAFTGPSEDSEAVFSDLYGFAVQVLDSHMESDAADWRLEALSLEVTAYAAHRSGIAFRPELIDVLFPIATLLGSGNPGLQQHAIAALNGLSLSCQYVSVSELIIDNVDYMINSVSLRLNTLDVSPASMQVLLMMIRLAGPRLIPFLDDVVDSIFAALDNYHGYTFFVESLFSVLKEVVDQASRTDQRLLTERERKTVDHKKKPPKKDGLDDILELLDKRVERRARDAAEAASGKPIEGHPEAPWASEPAGEDGEDSEEESQDQAGAAPSEEKLSNSPTYQLLLRIASLTQNYLTSPTPKLRRSLLELLTTASPILAGDEDAFLPLVNEVWPVVISRLYDPEAFIKVEACYALSGLCEAAGDFLSSRFKTEWGDGLGDWCRKVKQQASSGPNRFRPPKEVKSISGSGKGILIPIRSGGGLEGKEAGLEVRTQSSGSLGQHASPIRVWEAVVKLLTAIISYVQVDDEMFDQILDLLSDTLENSQEVREALETINADAVWLVRYERGHIEPLPTPKMEGVKLAEMVQMPRG
ncbi:TEL2-interacting protein 1 [Tolypocladium ophioglossoides CBS 100239]|uniref:TEL2-interacting protein 1 n=1 Tax=Tolypocladium ophioglossoides (strain CBS 100239) TaxID=1163406 RepID=A0A0L0NDT6_TOLOC|nr:TEL2-interacting protein 1 [Tolypocladium ophioglossoides CBS 100239]